MACKNPEKRREYERKWKAMWRLTPEGHLKNREASQKWRNNHIIEHRIG